MASGFLPDRDDALLAWSLNFSTRITSTPTAFGLTAPQATAYAALHTAYATALAACAPGDRTRAAVATKATARTSLKANARLLAKIVQGTASVTNAQKLELGLNVRSAPSPIPAPAYAPAVDIKSVTGRSVSIRLHDSTDAARRGKPAGVSGASVFSYVGAEPPVSASGWKFEGNTSTTTVEIAFPESVAPGAQVWISAYWFNPRKQAGPRSTPVSTNIQFGSSLLAA